MKTAMTQGAMDICASREAARVEAQRIVLYRRILARAHSVSAIAKIKKAEAQWVLYRKTYIEAMYPMEDKRYYGTVYPMQADLLYADVTRKHIEDLQLLLLGPAGVLCGGKVSC